MEEIAGIEINGQYLICQELSTEGFYRAFFHFCIDKYSNRIRNLGVLNRYFCKSHNDLYLERYLKIEEYQGYYFNIGYSTTSSTNIIETISKSLGIYVVLHYYIPQNLKFLKNQKEGHSDHPKLFDI